MSGNDIQSNEHAWLKSRLVAFHAGLLDEDELLRFQNHLQDCRDCQELNAEYWSDEESQETPDGHLPSDLVAQWENLSPRLASLERTLVARHLEDCGQCREDLEFLGFEPVLGTAPGTVVDSPSDVRANQKSDWKTWAGMSWGGLATAALLLVFLWPDNPPVPSTGINQSIPWIMPSRLRGDGNPESLTIGTETRQILVAVRVPVDWPKDIPAIVDVFQPGNHKLTSVSVGKEDLMRGTLMLYLEMGEQPEAGIYRVVFRPADGADTSNPGVETRFELEFQE